MATKVETNGISEPKTLKDEDITMKEASKEAVKNKTEVTQKSSEKVDTVKTETEEKDTVTKKEPVKVTPELQKKIINQIEYYFGDYNLPRDKFLKEEIKSDDGWISMDTMLKFKRLANLTTEATVVLDALKTSESGLMEIDAEKNKIRRTPSKPLPLFDDNLKTETAKRSIYCKGFAKDGSCVLDDLLEFFKQYGTYETVHMRHYFSQKDQMQGFKGSILIVFPDVEQAKTFMDIDQVKYKGTPLIRKFYEEYLQEKKAEIEERRAKKEARSKENKNDSSVKFEELPAGLFLHFSGAGNEVSREDIKGVIAKTTEDLAFVDYNKGDKEGFLRFSKPEGKDKVMEKLEGKLKIKEYEMTLRIVEGDEEKTQLEKANSARSRALSSAGQKRKFGGHRGGGRGGRNKRRRN